MSHPYDDPMEMEMAPLPASFLARLQPAGAFLTAHAAAPGAQSPTAQRPEAPQMAPLKASLARSLIDSKPQADVAMSFLSAMRRGLDGLQDSDSDDDEEDEEDDDEGAYYQPAYSQYHAPTTSFTGRASAPLANADDEDLIFPLEF